MGADEGREDTRARRDKWGTRARISRSVLVEERISLEEERLGARFDDTVFAVERRSIRARSRRATPARIREKIGEK